jgi:hypothetical protein
LIDPQARGRQIRKIRPFTIQLATLMTAPELRATEES